MRNEETDKEERDNEERESTHGWLRAKQAKTTARSKASSVTTCIVILVFKL